MNIIAHLFYFTFTYKMCIWFLILYYKMTKTGNILNKVKSKSIFALFCQIRNIYWINKGKQLMEEIFVELFFAKVPSIKFLHWNKPNVLFRGFFWFQTSPSFSSYLQRNLSIVLNLKISIILFVLRYIRHKVCVKSGIWDSNLFLYNER